MCGPGTWLGTGAGVGSDMLVAEGLTSERLFCRLSP
jgi:hypothetical protein